MIAVGTSFHWRRGIIRIYRLRDKQEFQAIETPCPWIQGLAFMPDGRRIVAGLSDTSIVIWDVRRPGADRADEPDSSAGRPPSR